MAKRSDRDRTIEQLLRQRLQRPSTPSTSACVDAEALAAWTARSLGADESAVVEQHLSTCPRCQAMLAVFVETEPTAPAAVSFWRRWQVRWLAPAAALGAAALLLVVVNREMPSDSAPTTMARLESSDAPALEQAPSDSAAPMAPPNAQAASGAAAATSPSGPRVQATPGPAPSASARMADAEAAPPPPSAPSVAAAQSPGEAFSSAPSAAPRPASPPPAAERAGAGAQATVEERRADTAQQIDSGRTTAALRARGESSGTQQAIPSVVPSQATASAAAVSQGFSEAGRDTIVEFSALPDVDTQADVARPATRWRIDAAGRVSRSIDNARSWTSVPLDPSLFIVAGASPVPGVCWLVDRGGAVLRAIGDGEFERTAFAESTALTAIRATDARHATVIGADGRAFTTADGGATWRLAEQ